MPMEQMPQPYRLEQAKFFTLQSPLLAFQRRVTSQFGEDGIIEKIFDVIKPINQYCVEFGAWDGKHLSNCWSLVNEKKWAGCFIEGDALKSVELMKTYAGNNIVHCLNRYVEFSGANSLDYILREIGAPANLDFASIDVDGTDYFIWESLSDYRPRLVVIEFNPTIPNDVLFVQKKSSEVNQGCSLLALIVLGKEKGYELVCCTECNAFFVEKELYALLNIPNNFIHFMYQPSSDGRIFQGYDSQIFVTGMPKLVWANIEVGSNDFQVLPASMRRYGNLPQR